MMLAKVDIARQQIETAIWLHVEKGDYVSAITLAGAGEEILGKLIMLKGTKSAQEELISSLIAKYVPSMTPKELRDKFLNKTKNALKHLGDGNEAEIKIEPEVESVGWLARAISNFVKLKGSLTPRMQEFVEFVVKHYPDLLA